MFFDYTSAAGAGEVVKGWDELVYMQDMNPTACSQAPLNTQKTLTDSRDGNTYTIARIKNQTNDEAKCWMTQNLRLVGNKTLSPEDSDIDKEYNLPATVTISASDNPKQFSTSDQYQSKVYYDNNTAYGAYYNWYTATAGSYDANASVYGTIALYSICPKGWKLPTGGMDGDYYKLASGLTVDQSIVAPYNFVHGGVVQDSALSSAGSGFYSTGYYWSSMIDGNNSTQIYILFAGGNYVGPSNGSYRYLGLSVRCVAR